MAKEFACALTHVRHEGFFLEKWIDHYGALVGRENLYVVIDGDDWEPEVDLTGIETEVLLDAPRRRIRNDRFMAKEMSARANQLRKRYDHVIRGDVDEYVVVDPASGLDWPAALQELTEEGYIFALGVDVVQHAGKRSRSTAPRPSSASGGTASSPTATPSPSSSAAGTTGRAGRIGCSIARS
jgi:hypothetical protein